MNERNKRSTGGLPPLLAVMLFLTSTTGNALAADDKACSQQERTNKTPSEKLDQTAGVICPPDIDPAIKAPTPNHRLFRHRAALVAIRPSSPSDPCDRETACDAYHCSWSVKHRSAFNRRDLAEPKREPRGFYARLSVKPETQVGLPAPVSPNPTSSSPAGIADNERKFGEAGTACRLAIAAAPSVIFRGFLRPQD